MASRTNNNSKKSANNTIKKTAKKAVKKAYKNNKKLFITVVIVTLLILAIALTAFYFIAPDKFNQVLSLFITPDTPQQTLVIGENDLTVHFLDVGQGDCIYIAFPDGKDMIIDCGNKSSNYDYSVTENYLDSLNKDNTVDYLMLTHCDEDHVNYLDEIVKHYQINNIYMPNVLAKPGNSSARKQELQTQIDALNTSMFTDEDCIDTIVYAEFFISALTEPNCNVVINMDNDVNSNTIVIGDDSYNLTFYCPTKQYYQTTKLNNAHLKNAISPIGILTYNGRKIVLTGDSNEENEPIFVDRINAIDCDVLKVGHHGSETSTTVEFLNAITCEYAVISCNENGNTFVHPRQATLDRLKQKNYTVYRTDNNGNIVLKVDKNGNITFVTQKTVEQNVNFIGADTDND